MSEIRYDLLLNISLATYLYPFSQYQTFGVYVMLQVLIKWPQSRDEVWKINIPHTHLAHEKSDQNWMVVKGEKIEFPGGGTHFHHGADKYIAHMANVRLQLSLLVMHIKHSEIKYVFHFSFGSIM